MNDYILPIKVGDYIIFSSLSEDEDDLRIGTPYLIHASDWGGNSEFMIYDENDDSREYPLTHNGRDDGYKYEILVLEND